MSAFRGLIGLGWVAAGSSILMFPIVPALTRAISCWLLSSATKISWFTVASRVRRRTSCWVDGSSLTRASSLALSSVRRSPLGQERLVPGVALGELLGYLGLSEL